MKCLKTVLIAAGGFFLGALLFRILSFFFADYEFSDPIVFNERQIHSVMLQENHDLNIIPATVQINHSYKSVVIILSSFLFTNNLFLELVLPYDYYTDIVIFNSSYNSFGKIINALSKWRFFYKRFILFDNILTSSEFFNEKTKSFPDKCVFKRISYSGYYLSSNYTRMISFLSLADNLLKTEKHLRISKLDKITQNCSSQEGEYYAIENIHQFYKLLSSILSYKEQQLASITIGYESYLLKHHIMSVYQIAKYDTQQDSSMTDLIVWSYFNSSKFTYLPDKEHFGNFMPDDTKTIISTILEQLKTSNRVPSDYHIQSGFHRFYPESGTEMQLILRSSKSKRKLTTNDRIFKVFVPLSVPQAVHKPLYHQSHDTESFTLVIVRASTVTLSSKVLDDFRWNFVHNSELAYLVIFVKSCGGNICAEYQALVPKANFLNKQYSTPNLVRLQAIDDKLSDAALLDRATRLVSAKTTLLWSNTDALQLSSELLHRVNRLLDGSRYCVLLPVPFQQYNISLYTEKSNLESSVDISRDQGRFDPESYPVLVIRTSNWKFIEQNLKHSSKTPHTVVVDAGLPVLRYIEPALLLRWSNATCHRKTSRQCANAISPQHILAQLAHKKWLGANQ